MDATWPCDQSAGEEEEAANGRGFARAGGIVVKHVNSPPPRALLRTRIPVKCK